MEGVVGRACRRAGGGVKLDAGRVGEGSSGEEGEESDGEGNMRRGEQWG